MHLSTVLLLLLLLHNFNLWVGFAQLSQFMLNIFWQIEHFAILNKCNGLHFDNFNLKFKLKLHFHIFVPLSPQYFACWGVVQQQLQWLETKFSKWEQAA